MTPPFLIKGLFSERVGSTHVASGSAMRNVKSKVYWLAEEDDHGVVWAQKVNRHSVPAGVKRRVPRDEFLRDFEPEPEHYAAVVYPAMRKLGQTVARGERFRANGAPFSAEMEFSKAIGIDEEHIRANFGLGLVFLERGDTKRAHDIFRRLVALDEAFEEKHKHLFNEFGIRLRKNKMYVQALDYYERAMSLSPQDEHVHYNMAKAHFMNQDLPRAVNSLRRALVINEELAPAEKFLRYLQKKHPDINGEGATL